MNRKERLALAHWAVEHARKCGADEVSVDVTYTRDIEITYRDDMLEQLKESTTHGLQLSIYHDHRFSGHSTNDVRKDAVAMGQIREELADITAFVLSFASTMNIDISSALADKMKKNAVKYPAETYRGKFKL